MKNIRRLAVWMCMALMLVLTGTLTAEAAGQDITQEAQPDVSESDGSLSENGFRIRAVIGLNGYYKQGAPVPLTLYVERTQEDFEGILRVIVPGSEYEAEAIAYEKDVMLAAGEEKVISLSVNNLYGMNKMRMELVDASGQVVLEYDIQAKNQMNESVLVGILCDDFTALNYFDGIRLNFGSYTSLVQIVELNADTFPEQSSGLEALGYLIINSFDTSKLSHEQYDALKNWVESGGVLVIGTGSDYRQTLSGMQDGFIGGEIGSFCSGELRLEGEDAGVPFTEDDGIIRLSMDSGNPMSGVFSDPELAWSQEMGMGQVVMTAMNLGMEPVRSWDGKNAMAVSLLEAAASGYTASRIQDLNYGSSSDTWDLSYTLNGLYETKSPDIPVLAILLAVFAILAGPGLYLILKAADKREWMWVIVPALSIVVTAGIFLLSRDIRITSPREASVTSVYYDAEEDAVSQEVFLGIQVPGASEEEVTLGHNLSRLRFVESYDYSWYDYYTDGGDDDRYAYKTAVRERPDGYLLTLRNEDTFDSAYMTAEYTPDSQEGYGLETELSKSLSGIRGKVTNTTPYDLKAVSVYTNQWVVVIDELKAGESAEFEESDCQYFQLGYVDFYSFKFPSLGEDEKIQNQVSNIWNLFCNQYLYNCDSMSAYTFAWIPEWQADYISREDVTEVNSAMLVRKDRVPYEDYPDAKSLTLFQYTVGSPDNWDTDGWMYDSEVEVLFDISDQINEIYAMIRADDDVSQWGSTGNVAVYAYNLQSGEYDELFMDGYLMKFEDGCPYMDEDGVIRMKFVGPPVGDDVDYAPEITVIGGAR